MDFISIPVGQPGSSGLSYRTFSPAEIRNATGSGLFVIAVLSGPFQRIVDEKGLQVSLADIARDSAGMRRAIEREAGAVNSLLKTCMECGADAGMIAEDIAFDNGSFFAPKTFNDIFKPLYSEFVDNIHSRKAFAVFHSCGNITNLVPDIISLKFDGLSCQVECLDILSLKRTYGAQITLFTGLSREFLENESLSASQKRRFTQTVTGLRKGGGFVLSSSSGLYLSSMTPNLRALYCLADSPAAGASGDAG
jgi:uroporphyrinogen decarboxylase